MKSYIKFLSRNKLYTAIEAVGLIVSLAFVIIIATSVRNHWRLTHDRPGQENLYLAGPAMSPYIQYRDMVALGTIPEVKRTSGLISESAMAEVRGEKRQIILTMADPDILDITGLKIIAGNDDLFRSGAGVLISEPTARKLFPDSDPLGQLVTIEERIVGGSLVKGLTDNEENLLPLPVTGITADPGNTILSNFDFLICFRSQIPIVNSWRDSDLYRTGVGSMVLPLVELEPNADRDAFRAKYAEVARYNNRGDEKDQLLTPFHELYGSTTNLTGIRQGKLLYLIVLVILGLIMLLSAVLNYANLSLAASGARAKEMATRRLVGDDRRGIIRRTVGESLLFTFVCYILATLLAVAIVPALNSLRPPGLAISFCVSFDWFFILFSLVAILGIGGLAGLIPAGFLASWRPLDVISGRVRRKRKMWFSGICIVLQTALALLLIVMSLTIQSQLRHLRKLDIGISPESELFYFNPNLYYPMDVLADKLRSSPMVQEIGFATAIPMHASLFIGGGQDYAMLGFPCDSTAFRLLGYRILEEYEPFHSGLIYLTEEARDFLKVSREDPGRYGEDVPIGGIIGNFRRLPVNALDNMSVYTQMGYSILNAVIVGVNADMYRSGLLLRTVGSRKEFKEYFYDTAREWFKEQTGFSDVFSGDEEIKCGYLDEIIANDYNDLSHYSSLVGIFAMIAILLAMLGLLAVSTYYAGSNTKGIAIRKVFGGTMNSEAWRSVLSYMLWVLAAIVITVPVGVVLVRRFLQDYPERISGYWWIFVVAVLLVLMVSFAAVLWQTLKAAKTNPAMELKKE